MPQKPGFPWPTGWPDVLPKTTDGEPVYYGVDWGSPDGDRSVGFCTSCWTYVELPHECSKSGAP